MQLSRTLWLVSVLFFLPFTACPQENGQVEVVGAFTFPGTYVLEHRQVSLDRLLERVGGVTDEADLDAAVVKRPLSDVRYRKLLEAISILSEELPSGAGMVEIPDPGEYYFLSVDFSSVSGFDIRAGDVLFVPVKNNTIEISGAVRHPNVVSFEKERSLREYVDMAGGLADGADFSRVSIRHPGGDECGSGDPDFVITPGSRIEVPLQTEDFRRVSSARAVRIASGTGSVAGMVKDMIRYMTGR